MMYSGFTNNSVGGCGSTSTQGPKPEIFNRYDTKAPKATNSPNLKVLCRIITVLNNCVDGKICQNRVNTIIWNTRLPG